MYEIITDNADSKLKIVLKGELTIQNALAVKDGFANSINNCDCLVIDQKDTEEYDLSYLQLLISLKNSAAAAGKKIELITRDEKHFKSFIIDLGCGYESWFSKIVLTENTNGE